MAEIEGKILRLYTKAVAIETGIKGMPDSMRQSPTSVLMAKDYNALLAMVGKELEILRDVLPPEVFAASGGGLPTNAELMVYCEQIQQLIKTAGNR
jgi:hypothetical protein